MTDGCAVQASPLQELKVGLENAGIDYRELVTTSIGAEAATFVMVNCSVGMVDGDDRFHFGQPDPNVTSLFAFDAQGKLSAKRSAFNLGLLFDSAEARSSAPQSSLAWPGAEERKRKRKREWDRIHAEVSAQDDMSLPAGCLSTCDWRGGPIHAPDCPNQ